VKETNVDKLENILARMQKLKKSLNTDSGHNEADSLLIDTIEVLQELEHVQVLQVVGNIIDAYYEVEKWYA
jgi:division protein CdvB (Snf7/Vps24/ESCRT-III family)